MHVLCSIPGLDEHMMRVRVSSVMLDANQAHWSTVLTHKSSHRRDMDVMRSHLE